MGAERMVIVGGDAAGMSAAMAARRRRGRDDLEIVAFERGPYPSYSACGIPFYLGGIVDPAERLLARTPAEFAEHDVRVALRTEVVAIDLGRRRLTVLDLVTASQNEVGFDTLVYAAGAEAILPDVPGAAACEVIRTVEAAERFRARLDDDEVGPTAVVIGAGYIGLEMAEALAHRGLRVSVVDRADQVMTSLDADVAARVRRAAEGEGIDVYLGVSVDGIELDRDGRPQAVVTSAGTFAAQVVVCSAGVRPAVRIAAAAGLTLGPTGALAVDDHQRCPGHDGVFAAGDCVESHHRVLGRPVNIQLGTHANRQGRIAGTNATGGDVAFGGVLGTAATRVCRTEIARTGLSDREAREAGLDAVSITAADKTKAGYFPEVGEIHTKVTAERGSGRLLGAQIVGAAGSAKRIDVFATALWAGLAVDDLAGADLSYAPPFSGVYDPVVTAARVAAKAAAEARPKRDVA